MTNSKNQPPDGRVLNLTAAAIELSAASPENEAQRLRRFTMTAYTGGAMQLAGWRYPMVVDLQGLHIGKQTRPILLDHVRDVDFVLGQTDSIAVLNQQLIVAGQVMGDSPKTKQVIALNDKGFSWQASIGARAEQIEFVAEGKTSQVNGREFPGPVNIVRRATLGEISFVVLGADENTSAQIAAGAAKIKENQDMDFTHWLEAQGFAADAPTEQQTTSLRALYDAQATKPASADDPPDPSAEMRSLAAAESQRIAGIRKLRAKHPDLEAKAIVEGWDVVKTELEVIRADRPAAPQVFTSNPPAPSAAVLEAAICAAARLDDLDDHFDEPTLETAHQRYHGQLGLQELLLEAAWANGYTGRNFRDVRTILRFAFPTNLQAGLSTIEVGGIMSNVANKFLLAGFQSVESTWRNICAIRNVSDFKTVTSYRLIGKEQYELIPPGGEIKHGTLGEERYQNRADTYGLMLSIDRRDIINDDLDALTAVPRKLGRGAGLKINDVFWSTFLANSAFFTAANKNLLVGADTVLSIDGLTKAEVAFLEQVDSDGKPIGVMPAILLVPTALSAIGSQLFKSLELRDNTSSVKYPITNPHQGKFRVEVSRYLSNSQYAGNSAKAWYLLAEPTDLPVIEVAFLNGQEGPVIETAEADFNVLGVQMRGHSDFGVNLQDSRGGVKLKGEA